MWLAIAIWLLLRWRPVVVVHARSPEFTRAVLIATCVFGTFVVVAAPLIWETARLLMRHEYVTQQYFWRSAPHGVDLLAPFLGHPLHPLMRATSARAYASIHADVVESIGWLGVTPLVLLALTYPAWTRDERLRVWRAVAIVFAVWAAGPFLTIGGADIGLRLPAILLRYVPFVANARMPGRAIVIVYMALAILIASGLPRATGRLRSTALQCLLIALVVFEYWQAPITLTPLDEPAVYSALAHAGPGAVCEVPFGIGDGLGGVGAQDRRVLFYATLHAHPLVGGYIGRMPADAADRYARMPVAGSLLRLSAGEPLPDARDTREDATQSPCRYLVVHRSAASAALLDYVTSLRPTLIASSGNDELYRLAIR
jgi:hypothetical protein